MIPDVEEIVDDVYQLTLKRPEEGPDHNTTHYRSYLFDMPDDVPTLVDTCHDYLAPTLFDRVEQVGVEPERVIISHKHPDHAGAFEAVVERYDPDTWVPEADDLTTAERVDATTPADHLYGHEERIGRFTAVHIGGHTPGSSVVIDEAAGIAVCGDSLSGSDRRGLPPGYLIHPPQGTNNFQDPEAIVEAEINLVRLLPYDFDVALVFHGSSVLEDASEKLERYVNFEPNFADPDSPSIHSPERTPSNVDEVL